MLGLLWAPAAGVIWRGPQGAVIERTPFLPTVKEGVWPLHETRDLNKKRCCMAGALVLAVKPHCPPGLGFHHHHFHLVVSDDYEKIFVLQTLRIGNLSS